MIKWLHHLLNPHCAECKAEKECSSCFTLLQQLAFERSEKERLLNLIIEMNKPQAEVPQEPTEMKEISNVVPWRVRQQMLEQEDRAKAAVIKRKTEELEKEVGISNA